MDFLPADALESEGLRKIFIGGLNRNTSDEKLKEHFSQHGNLVDCIVIRDNMTKESRGFGFVTYDSLEGADSCVADCAPNIDNKDVEVKRAIPRELGSSSYQTKTKKMFIGGLPKDVTEKQIEQLFNECALNVKVEQIDLIRDKETQQPKGFGFVTFEDEDHVAKVAIVHYFNIGQRKVEVKCAEAKEGGQGRGGGRGGRGMGGGGRGMRGGSRGGARGGGRGGRGGSYNQNYDSYNQYSNNDYGGNGNYQGYQSSGYGGNDYGFGGGSGGNNYWDQGQGGGYENYGGYSGGGGGGGGGFRGGRGSSRYSPY